MCLPRALSRGSYRARASISPVHVSLEFLAHIILLKAFNPKGGWLKNLEIETDIYIEKTFNPSSEEENWSKKMLKFLYIPDQVCSKFPSGRTYSESQSMFKV